MKLKFSIVAVVLIAFFSVNVYAMVKQPTALEEEPSFKNLKILPQDISNEDLKQTMKFFSDALGVKCGFCHVAKEDNPKELDFASDANYKKDVARYMMKMTHEINEAHFKPFIGHDGAEIVPNTINCMTCHNGQKEPATTPAIR